MYVIVEIQGQQFKVENGKKLFVHYLGAEHGAVLEFGKKGLVKGERILVFKKKRRKGYRRLNGHRQYFTEVLVKEIVA